MGDVINIFEKRDHLSGDALCLACGYKWVAIAPAGTVELECSECHTFKGVFVGMARPEVLYECLSCGNQHFYIDEESSICSRCGLRDEP